MGLIDQDQVPAIANDLDVCSRNPWEPEAWESPYCSTRLRLPSRQERYLGRRRFSRPQRLGQPKVTAVVEVEIRLSAR
jgi:hypothetical protein